MISRFWQDTEERDEITRFHKPYWQELRRKHGNQVDQIPGFVESLRKLLEVQGYCLTDVAAMFGVSRERVRQWAEKFGIEPLTADTIGSLMRVWDDDLSRFRLLGSTGAYEHAVRQAEQKRRAEAKRRRYQRRILRYATLLRQFVRDHGYVPHLREFTQYALGLPERPTTNEIVPFTGSLATAFGIGANAERSYSRAADRLYEYAGFERPDGREAPRQRNTKLTWAAVREIRDAYENTNITQRELGERYGVQQTTIWQVVNYQTWKNGKK